MMEPSPPKNRKGPCHIRKRLRIMDLSGGGDQVTMSKPRSSAAARAAVFGLDAFMWPPAPVRAPSSPPLPPPLPASPTGAASPMVGVRPLSPMQAFGVQALLHAASKAGGPGSSEPPEVAAAAAAPPPPAPSWCPGEVPPRLVFTDVGPGTVQWAAYKRTLSQASRFLQLHAVLEVTSPAQASRLAATTRQLECDGVKVQRHLMWMAPPVGMSGLEAVRRFEEGTSMNGAPALVRPTAVCDHPLIAAQFGAAREVPLPHHRAQWRVVEGELLLVRTATPPEAVETLRVIRMVTVPNDACAQVAAVVTYRLWVQCGPGAEAAPLDIVTISGACSEVGGVGTAGTALQRCHHVCTVRTRDATATRDVILSGQKVAAFLRGADAATAAGFPRETVAHFARCYA